MAQEVQKHNHDLEGQGEVLDPPNGIADCQFRLRGPCRPGSDWADEQEALDKLQRYSYLFATKIAQRSDPQGKLLAVTKESVDLAGRHWLATSRASAREI